MRDVKIRKIGWLLAYLLLYTPVAFSQYAVEGSTKEPYVITDKANRIQVYLVYGIENVTISYTSESTSHQWYRYKTKAAEREKITSSQQGTTSIVSNLTEGYGYAVISGDNYAYADYIWLIDYSKYPVDIQNLHVNQEIDPCIGFQLDGTDLTPKLTYRTPAGVETLVPRKYEVSYWTLVWNESNKQFSDILTIDTLDQPIRKSIKSLPLRDTDIELSGDLIARHFGVEKSFKIDFFEASKIEVYSDTMIMSQGVTNLSAAEAELLAPAEVHFAAYANTPVASLFIWQIFNDKDPEKPIVRFTEPEIDYVFNQIGDYTIRLEVSDRSGRCVDTEQVYKVSITETVMRVPNAFTPVGSPGINDVFKVAHKSIIKFNGWIFNRWGSELFHWTDPAQGWDGKYRGRNVPAGPYFYVIEYTGTDGKKKKKSGDVNVIHIKDNESITE